MDDVIDCMTFYNHRVSHLTLGYVSPMKFKQSCLASSIRKTAKFAG
jgi:hypothetical protein